MAIALLKPAGNLAQEVPGEKGKLPGGEMFAGQRASAGEGVKKLTRRVILSEGKDRSILFSVHTVILRCLRMTTEGMSMTYSKFFTSSESSF